ncbi:MAG: hypothetical protein HY671_14385 [Chloroflexi bacterium]|nr:hypothetical protein [Chloroflexota bacterium]
MYQNLEQEGKTAIGGSERKHMLLKEYWGKSSLFHVDSLAHQTTYLTRVDPISGGLSKISVERAQRAMGIVADFEIRPIEKCDFCEFEKHTPVERVDHDCGCISVPNKYPWEKHDWITIYPPYGHHKLLLSDLYFEDLERMIESSYDLALLCSKDPDVISFMDFTNWGPFAGASQQHPHSQRRSVTFVPDPGQQKQLERCRTFSEMYNANLFDLLAEEEIRDGRRVIYNNDVLVLSSFAPCCSDEVTIFPRAPISHILQTTPAERKAMMRPILGIFPALFFYRGVSNINIAVHMAPFREMEEARGYYRWHMHIYPRRAKLPIDRAGAEIGFDTNVIEVMPERSAGILREWYTHPPREDMIARLPDGSPNEKLLAEFRKLMAVGVNNHH